MAELAQGVARVAGRLLALTVARVQGQEDRRGDRREGGAAEARDQHHLGARVVQRAGQRELEHGAQLVACLAGPGAREQDRRQLAAGLDQLTRLARAERSGLAGVGDQRDLGLAKPAQDLAPGFGQGVVAERRHPRRGLELDALELLAEQRLARLPHLQQRVGHARVGARFADHAGDVELVRIRAEGLGVGAEELLGRVVVGVEQRDDRVQRAGTLEVVGGGVAAGQGLQRRQVDRVELEQPVMVAEHLVIAGDLAGLGQPLVEARELLAVLDAKLGVGVGVPGLRQLLGQAGGVLERGRGLGGGLLGLQRAEPDQQGHARGQVLFALVAIAGLGLLASLAEPGQEARDQRLQLVGAAGGLEHLGLGEHRRRGHRGQLHGTVRVVGRDGDADPCVRGRAVCGLGAGLGRRVSFGLGPGGVGRRAHERDADPLEQQFQALLVAALAQQQPLEAAQRQRGVVRRRGPERELQLRAIQHGRRAVRHQDQAHSHVLERLALELGDPRATLAAGQLAAALGLADLAVHGHLRGVVVEHPGVDPGRAAGEGILDRLGEPRGVLGGPEHVAPIARAGDDRRERSGVAGVELERAPEPSLGLLGALALELALARDRVDLGGELGLAGVEHERLTQLLLAGLESLVELVDGGEHVAVALGGHPVADHGQANREVVAVVAQRGGQPSVGFAAAVRGLEHPGEQQQALDEVGLITDEGQGLDRALELLLGLGERARVEQQLAEPEPGLGVIGVGLERRFEARPRGRDIAGGPVGDAPDLGQEPRADAVAAELRQLLVHERRRAVEVTRVDPQSDQTLDRSGQAGGPAGDELGATALIAGLALGGVEDPAVGDLGPLRLREATAGDVGGLEHPVGIAEPLEPIDEHGLVVERPRELGPQRDQLVVVGGQLERAGEQLERRRVPLALFMQDPREREAEVADPLAARVLIGLVRELGVESFDALAQQRDPGLEPIRAAIQPAEPERDLVVLGGLGGQLLEGLGRGDLVAQPLLQRASLDHQELDPRGLAGLVVERRVAGHTLEPGVEDRQQLVPASGLEIQLLQFHERALVLGPQLAVVVPRVDRPVGQGQALAVDLGDRREVVGLRVGVEQRLVGGPQRVDRLGPLLAAQQQSGHARRHLGPLGEVAGQEPQQLERVVAPTGLFVELGQAHGPVHALGVVELPALGVEQIRVGLDVVAASLELLVDDQQLVERADVRRVDGQDRAVAGLGWLERVVVLMERGDPQVERDDVLGQRGLVEQLLPRPQQPRPGAVAGRERLETGHALGLLGDQQQRPLVTDERALDQLGAVFPQARAGQVNVDLLLLVGGGQLGVSERELFPGARDLGSARQHGTRDRGQLGQPLGEVEAVVVGDVQTMGVGGRLAALGRERGERLGQRDGLAAKSLGRRIQGRIELAGDLAGDLALASLTLGLAWIGEVADHPADRGGLEIGRGHLLDVADPGLDAVEVVDLLDLFKVLEVVDQLDHRVIAAPDR
ncbi:hypothetical protein ENSA7_42310 [Enhygromyxa salina]|uniref:Uncharacterized protein n=1 Tax=Enhygromyxa salina TaxID=215803 RepID=A0A2S9YLU2_9BACT|nr:hypothetical protein ENSA7_42310 [Enhygromyxa salina]